MAIMLFSFASAESIGTFQIGEEMQITNYCQDGSCSYMTLTSLEYPNGTIIYPDASMTNNNQGFNYSFTPEVLGTYVFKTCGNPSGKVICNSDSFQITPSGADSSSENILAFIFIGLIFVVAFVLIIYLRKNFNEDKWYNKMKSQYENKNFVKLVFSGIGYSFLKNMYVIYYSLGFIILNLIADASFTYNINSIYTLMKSVLFVYTWGFILLGIVFLGKVQEWIMYFVNEFKDKAWGIRR